MTFEDAKKAIEAGVRTQDSIQQVAGYRNGEADVLLALVTKIEALEQRLNQQSINMGVLQDRQSGILP